MIFFCFSSKDRHTIVDAILFHITKYEIPVWYDRQQMLLGDDRNHKNFTEGVEKASYFTKTSHTEKVCRTLKIQQCRQ